MSGGTWQTQNKVRAGAYINFKAVNQDSWNPSDRNIMTMPVELSWGPDNEIIELTADQLTDGTCEKIIGYKATDNESLVIREALSNCYKALIYKINSEGGAKATYSAKDKLGNVLYKVEAKYKGKCGNFVSYKVVENDSDNTMVDLITYYRENEKDKQTVSRLKTIRRLQADGLLKNNDYLSIIANDKQCKGAISGDGFRIACEANKKTLIGEEGNNLTISLETNEDNATLVIKDDEQRVLEAKIAYDKEFVASDLPENNYVVFLDDTSGIIKKAQGKINDVPFSQVHDARLKLEAGATLEDGIDGKATTRIDATGKWGGLTAVSKLAAEKGNNLSFTVEKDTVEVSNSEIPVIFSADLVKVPNDGTQYEIVNVVKLRNKDPLDEDVYRLGEVKVKKIIPQHMNDDYDRPWEVIQIQKDVDRFHITLKTGILKDKNKTDYCLIHLQGPEMIVNKTTGKKYDCSLIIKVCDIIPSSSKPILEVSYDRIHEQETAVTEVVSFDIVSKHQYDKTNVDLVNKEKWKVTSNKAGSVWTIEDIYLMEDEQRLRVKVKNDSGIMYKELVKLTLDNSVKPFLDMHGQKVDSDPISYYVIEGLDGSLVRLLHLRSETLDLSTECSNREFDVIVTLANNLENRYKFNSKALVNSAFAAKSVLDNDFEIQSISRVADDDGSLEFKIRYDGQLPYNANERLMIDTIAENIITDGLMEQDVPLVGYTLAIKFHEKVEETDRKIVINDNSANGVTVAQIHKIPGDKRIEELVAGKYLENNYILFGGSGELHLTEGAIQLSGGDAKADLYTAENGYFSQVKGERWNCMALPQENVSNKVKKLAVQLIKDLRENQGIKCQLVLANYAGNNCNYEGVISVKQGYKTEEEIIPRHIFTATVAGMTAGASFSKSNTFKVIEGATDIIYYDDEKPYTNEDYLRKLKEGHFLLTKRRDLSIVCEKDQNTLHEPYPTNDVNYSFTKNRVIRTLDEINNTVVDIWESRFVGKVTNNDKGRTLYRTALINYIQELERLEAVQNFDPQKDVVISQGQKIDAVVVDLAIQPTDAMEKLYMTININ